MGSSAKKIVIRYYLEPEDGSGVCYGPFSTKMSAVNFQEKVEEILERKFKIQPMESWTLPELNARYKKFKTLPLAFYNFVFGIELKDVKTVMLEAQLIEFDSFVPNKGGVRKGMVRLRGLIAAELIRRGVAKVPLAGSAEHSDVTEKFTSLNNINKCPNPFSYWFLDSEPILAHRKMINHVENWRDMMFLRRDRLMTMHHFYNSLIRCMDKLSEEVKKSRGVV